MEGLAGGKGRYLLEPSQLKECRGQVGVPNQPVDGQAVRYSRPGRQERHTAQPKR